jgi:hypothetical protein
MPAAHPINREELKAFCLATSLAEGARKWNLPLSTVRNIAAREKWKTPNRLKKAREEITLAETELAEIRGKTSATAGDALEEHLQSSAKSFRTGVASALAKIGETAAQMDGVTALDHARKIHDASQVAKLVLGIGAESSGPAVSINLLNMSAEALIDVTR